MMNEQNHSGEQNSDSSDPGDQQPNDSEDSLPSGPEGDEDPTFIEIPLEKYKTLQEQVTERDEYLKQLRQVTADYDNYQKRMRRKRSEEKKYAAREVINSIIPVLDDFDHALPEDPDEETKDLVQGMRMIFDKLVNALREQDVEVIDETDVPFDPNRHEAASSVQKEGIDKQYVVEVLRNGYQLHDQVLQPARVVIAQPASESE